MKPPRTDRERAITEQCWLGIRCLIAWAVVIMGVFRACACGDEVKFGWNANAADQQVLGYKLWRIGTPNLLLTTTAATEATVTAFAGEQVSVSAFNAIGESALSPPVTVPEPVPTAPTLDRSGWEIAGVSSMEIVKDDNHSAYAIDGDAQTFWHTEWTAAPPHYIAIRLPRLATVSALHYKPRRDGGTNGHITSYEVQSSLDGIEWETWAAGTWPANSEEKETALPLREIRFFRIWSQDQWAAAAEIDLAGTYAPEPPDAITLTIQQSNDLRAWAPLHTLTVPITEAGQFFRIKIEP